VRLGSLRFDGATELPLDGFFDFYHGSAIALCDGWDRIAATEAGRQETGGQPRVLKNGKSKADGGVDFNGLRRLLFIGELLPFGVGENSQRHAVGSLSMRRK